MRKAKALRVSIYEDKRIGNCSNNGISARYDEILLLCADGSTDVDLDNPPENLCQYAHRTLAGKEADYIRPYAEPKGVGWMYGGALIYTSDARFPGSHPVCLHDRDKSQEEYDKMTR